MFDHLWSYCEATRDSRWTNVIYKAYAVVNSGFATGKLAVIATNVFDGSGSFSNTNPVNPAVPKSFYLLRSQ